jgi:hypothetical protein
MNPTNNTSTCASADFPMRRKRHIRFVELWRMREWMLKIYLHSAHHDELPQGYLVKAKAFIEPHLSEAEQVQPLHRVGFMILAHGAVSNWVMLDWWSSIHLYQRIFQVEGMPPERFVEAPASLFQCVYDLRITAFESEAWRKSVVENTRRDLHGYLTAQLNIDV